MLILLKYEVNASYLELRAIEELTSGRIDNAIFLIAHLKVMNEPSKTESVKRA